MKRLASLVVASALVLAAPVAHADRYSARDPKDVEGPIDVARLYQGHYFSRVLYRVIARDNWDTRDLKGGRIVLSFDARGGPAFERRAIIKYRSGGGLGLRSKIVDAHGDRVGKGVLRRPSERSVEIWIKRRTLGDPKSYRMFATVKTRASTETCTAGCIDRVPDDGTLRHRLHDLCTDREPTITGTRRDDTLRATKDFDVISGLRGDDLIVGATDRDLVCGGRGDDTIRAGRGFLFLRGGPGRDRIELEGPKPTPCDDTNRSCAYPEATAGGGGGRDVLVGGDLHEQLLGGPGNDVLRGRGRSDRLDGGRGHDVIRGGRGEDSCKRGEELHSCG